MQTRFWVIAFLLFAGVLWLLEPMLLPFAAGLAIAYFLNPVVDKLTHRGVPRWLGALIVLAAFALVIGLVLLLITPLLQAQIGALIAEIPNYIEKFRTHFIPWVENWLTRFSPDDVDKIRDAATQYVGNAAGMAGKAVQNVVTSGLALIDVLALAIITPVVAFYLMRDWNTVTRTVDALIPRRHYDVIKEQLGQIDLSLSGFVRGQALVCLGLGLVYSLGLSACGLQYSVAIGVTAGILSFIPYVGTAFAWIVSIMIALAQFDNFERIGFVIAVLVLGHIMESYVLTPRLVGKRVGLHPVWILFALIAGGRIMGFTGVLIAVPVAAVLGVLTRFAVSQYKTSPYYEEPTVPAKALAPPQDRLQDRP
jgi:predicted PurR-regulated permease PerM